MLRQLVESVLAGIEVPDDIVVVDQSDEANSYLANLEPCRSCQVRYVWSRQVGLSRGVNLGVSLAKHDVVVFTHDDVLVAPAWLGTIVGALLDAGPRSVVTGRVLPTEPAMAGGFAPSVKTVETREVYEGRTGRDALYPQNMAMYREAILKVGGFDERIGPGTNYPAAEDNDFGFRLLEAGYRILYVPDAVVYHVAWRKASDFLPLRYSYGRGQGAYYAKHFSLKDRYMLRRFASDVVRHVRRGVGRLCHMRSPRPDGMYVLGMVSGAAQWVLQEIGARARRNRSHRA